MEDDSGLPEIMVANDAWDAKEKIMHYAVVFGGSSVTVWTGVNWFRVLKQSSGASPKEDAAMRTCHHQCRSCSGCTK